MSEPLKWDSALKWDSPGLTWDGVVPQPKKKMTNTKAIIDFTDYTASELGPIAQTIHDKMVLNAASFTGLPFTMAVLQTLIDTYATRLVARASKATVDVLAFEVTREEMEIQLATLGNYVNSVAKGDPVLVEKSGFPSYTTGGAPDPSAPAAPTNLRLRHGAASGSVVARFKPSRKPSANELETSTGDPNNEASWTRVGIFLGGKAELSGLTPGVVVWVRVRTSGLKGVMGDWSDPAQIRVL